MVDRDWHMMTETAMRSRFGWTADEHARAYAVLWRAAITPEMTASLMDSLREVDVTHLLPAVKAPTLVLHREDRGSAVVRRIATAIPTASVVLFPGGSAAPYLEDADDVWAAISDFLDLPNSAAPAPKEEAPQAQSRTTGALQTILFTDIEANTELLQRVGDSAWRDILREHERTTRALLAEHGGTEIKTIGDAFMTSFNSASAAIECAIALQQAFDHDPAQLHAPLRLRIGINAGEPIAEDSPGGRGDLFGTAVTTASRIQSLAKGGEILVSDVVRQLVAGKGFMFEDRGETVLRGFEDPVRIFAVRVSD
jgi:class 3 adenylate cyclase